MRRRAGLALAVLLGGLAGAPAGADEPPIGWHIIRPGDTLRGLSQQFLGDAEAWRRLHELNPRILDPNWIYPGRRVRVPIARPSARPNAQVTALAKRVEARPMPVEWLDAGSGDLLLERDGLRTYEGASASLLFDDGSTAVLSEDSLVFIRRQTPATAPSPRKEIEIELGQAEFETRPGKDLPAPEIEVVVGPTHSTMRGGTSSGSLSRHRRDGDNARVMLYRGAGEVRGASGVVALAEGSGTSVGADGRPTAPERLLAAPILVGPADGAEPPGGTPIELRWREVAGAVSYRVELCLDPACTLAAASPQILRRTYYTLAERPRKLVYWRVAAVSANGLDGYPSAARRLRPGLLVAIQ